MPEEAETADPKKCGWFKDEQLTAAEIGDIWDKVLGRHYDFILTHTCPLSWEPTDLFLGGIDQSRVDKFMETFLDDIKDRCSWSIWLFGHYHADRLERPYVEQFYEEVEDLESIIARWDKYKATGELDWWLPKARDFYMGVEDNG